MSHKAASLAIILAAAMIVAAVVASGPSNVETINVRDGEGVQRTFELHRPPKQTGPLPLVVAFHGGGGHARNAVHYGLENLPGAAQAAFFAYPEGRDFESNGQGWNDGCNGYDMVFFERLIEAIRSRYRIDENRIFVAGFSWGCDFVTALACCRGDVIRGVAAAACSDDFKDPADPATYFNVSCPVTSKAAIRFTHQDTSDSAYPAPLFATTSRLFQTLNACPAKPPKPDGPHCVAYQSCRQDLVECTYKGIGHAPGPNWAADTWAFFSKLH